MTTENETMPHGQPAGVKRTDPELRMLRVVSLCEAGCDAVASAALACKNLPKEVRVACADNLERVGKLFYTLAAQIREGK